MVFDASTGLIILRGQRTTRDLARGFICSRDRIGRFLAEHEPPFIAKFYCSDDHYKDGRRKSGRLELKFPHST